MLPCLYGARTVTVPSTQSVSPSRNDARCNRRNRGRISAAPSFASSCIVLQALRRPENELRPSACAVRGGKLSKPRHAEWRKLQEFYSGRTRCSAASLLRLAPVSRIPLAQCPSSAREMQRCLCSCSAGALSRLATSPRRASPRCVSAIQAWQDGVCRRASLNCSSRVDSEYE